MAERQNRRSPRSIETVGEHADGLRLLAPEWRRTLPERIERFKANQMSVAGIVVLMQDVIQVGLLAELPDKFMVAALHCCNQGLCTTTGRYLQ